MTILSKPFNLNRFLKSFYSFQTEMGIINQHCFHNVRYLKEHLKNFNIIVKDFNGFLIQTRFKGNCVENMKIEHNWVEINGEIIEPNKEIYNEPYKQYFRFSEKNKMYSLIKTSKKEKIVDLLYQKDHLIKYFKKSYGNHIKYENMLFSRIVNKDLCRNINNSVKIYNDLELLKQSLN